jgi:outer membrane protein assembly factor BamB
MIRRYVRKSIGTLLVVATTFGWSLTAFGNPNTDGQSGWLQWALNGQHTGAVRMRGQPLNQIVFDVVYDPLVPEEQAAAGGNLLTHYQVPLIDKDRAVYMEFKSGVFDPNTTVFATQTWSEKRLQNQHGQLQVQWSYDTDWKAPGSLNDFWEPVFHAVIVGRFLYLPGAGGSIWQLQKDTGAVVGRINPFGNTVDPTIFTASPLTADTQGNLYYNAIQLSASDIGFFAADVVDSWLVKVTPKGTASTVSYRTLVPNPPTTCLGTFSAAQLPWPPASDAVPPSVPCGTVRVGMNAAPAIGPDGTIYTVARMHLNSRYSWLVATNADLTPHWAASLRDRLQDGCRDLPTQPGVLPLSGTPGGCRAGAPVGVDPATNRPGGGRVLDDSSSTVVVAPDGVLYGAFNRYNYAQGHLMKFDFQGHFVTAFGFGWDSTPAIYQHDGTYSVVMKNNHYSVGSYCGDDTICPPDRSATNPASPEQYFVSQLTPDLTLEWSFQNTNTQSCTRNSDGSLSCVADHPAGFEWCVNAPVVDRSGVVYANSEDGNLYAINQGGTLKQRIFQQLALGAAYTPMSIGRDGELYSQNAGHLFIVGK